MILHSIYALYFNGCFRCSFFSVSSSFSFCCCGTQFHRRCSQNIPWFCVFWMAKINREREREIEKNKRHTHSISITISIQQQIVCIYKKSKLSSNVGSTTLAIRNTALRLREKKKQTRKKTQQRLCSTKAATQTHTRTKKSMQKK